MARSAEELVKLYDRKKADRANFDQRWDRMAPFIAPSRLGIIGGLAPGDSQTRGVYDSTGMYAAELMAQFIAGHIINPSQRWFGYVPYMQDPRIEIQDEDIEYAEECRDRSLARLANSFFYAEGPEALVDYTGFGTGCMFGEETEQPINQVIRGFRGFSFRAVKTGRFVILSESCEGLVDGVGCEYKLTIEKIKERWPGASLPADIANATDQQAEKLMIHVVLPRPLAEQSSIGGRGMPWASYWILHEKKHMVYESGFRVFPAAMPRYHRTPGEAYGRGRGDLVFPDVWTLNSAKRMGLEDWALKIKPPALVRSDSVIGTLRLVPGAPTTINTHGKPIGDSIAPWQTGSHPEVSQIKEEELRKSIRQICYVDQILMLLEVSKSEMTAFEFAKKIELLFRLLGPVYGRTEYEWLYRNMDNIFTIQNDAGDFPPASPNIQRNGGGLALRFENPLAKAQRSGDAEALLMAMNDVAPLAQQYPQMLDWIDPDETMMGILATRGVPAKWTRNKQQVKQLRDARSQQQGQEIGLEQAGQVASAVKDAAPTLQILQGGKP